MKEIKLTKGKTALVDDSDFNRLSKEKWFLLESRSKKTGALLTSYAYRRQGNRTVYMHREILDLHKGELGDHINGNGLDNQRNNLRRATASQNVANSQKTKGMSKYRGVSYHPQTGRWRAMICKDGIQSYLGLFGSEEEAAQVYNQTALSVFGGFVRLNTV